MRALTIYQPWASLIMLGAKPYEYRRWPAPKPFHGQRIVIHAAARRLDEFEVQDLLTRLDMGEETGLDVEKAAGLLSRVVFKQGKEGVHLPLSSGLGTAVLGEPVLCTELHAGQVADSDRIDEHMWAWPLTDIQAFEHPIPARGFQGFWTWNGEAP